MYAKVDNFIVQFTDTEKLLRRLDKRTNTVKHKYINRFLGIQNATKDTQSTNSIRTIEAIVR